MKPVNFGIDLGTTNSLIARHDGHRVQLFKNPIGQKETLASVVAFRGGRIIVGDKAREYLVKDPINVFGNFKRKMGTDEKYYVVSIDDNVTPVQLSAMVLRELKNFMSSNEVPEACVITIPASFDTTQSNATMKAGKEAGFKEVFLLQEPIAASLAFFNDGPADINKNGYWLVYDFGGGTFDAALVQATDESLKVIDHAGNNFLGGADFDFAIIENLVVPEIIRQTGILDFEEQLRTKYGRYEKLFYEIMYYAEEAKKELSHSQEAVIEFSAELEGKAYDFMIPVTRHNTDPVFRPIIDSTITLLKEVLERNQLLPADINQIILVGGSTFVPQVRERLSSETAIQLNHATDPISSVAIGASYYASGKFFEPAGEAVATDSEDVANELLSSIVFEEPDVSVEISYNSSSRDQEEVVLLISEGAYEDKVFRITRTDGGFDTGLTGLKARKAEFLPLLPSTTNIFNLQVYNSSQEPITSLSRQIIITQGKYNIVGQPLPHDICIEVDDLENHTTKMEAVFERNTLLPQKKTLYRQISKTIKKGSKDELIVNITEGDKNARPASNLTIGLIRITGRDLETDLLKGSDIEIKLVITDSRNLETSVFLVMSQQEFKNVFSISEKHVSLKRLLEQYQMLERELSQTVMELQASDNEIWAIKASGLLEELREIKPRLFKIKENDKSDERYVFAEKIRRVSQQADKLGGNERLASVVEQYLETKEQVRAAISVCDFDKPELLKKFQQLEKSEDSFIRSGNLSFIESKLRLLHQLHWEATCNTTSILISRYITWRELPADFYKDYGAARSVIKMADQSLSDEKYSAFRLQVFSLTHLMVGDEKAMKTNFKGTGIG